ncbi:hypothetical protein ACT3R7_19060 [Halomonas sp. AOP43-A1-21]
MITSNDLIEQESFDADPIMSDQASIVKTNDVDFFANVCEEASTLFFPYPDQLRYPSRAKLGYQDIQVPTCLKNTIIHKALAHQIQFWKGEKSSLIVKKNIYIRIFKKLQNEQKVDDKLLGAQINDAIKSLTGKDNKKITESTAKNLQINFLSIINNVLKNKPNEFNNSEIRLLNEIKRMTPVFESTIKAPTLSISQRYPQLPYTNADYIHSIRQTAFVQFEIWEKIRNRFKNECPVFYNELRNLLITQSVPYDLLANSIVQPKNNDESIRKIIYRIQNILINAALYLNDPILIETLFLSVTYRRKNGDHSYMFRYLEGTVILKPLVTLSYMRAYLKLMLKEDGTLRSSGRWIKHSKSNSGVLSVFTPYALLLPYGPDELAFYVALFASERCQVSTLLGITTDDILLLESNGKIVSEGNHSSKLKVNGFKGRNGKKDGSIYTKGSPFYRVARRLKEAFNEAIESRLIPRSNYRLFSSVQEDEFRFSSLTFLNGNLCNQKKLAHKTRVIIPLIEGTYYHAVMKKYVDNRAFLSLFRSQLKQSDNSKRRLLVPSNITQSRIYAEEIQDLSNFEISENFSLTYSEDLYERLSVVAPAQHHTVETRLNTYYQRSQDRIVIETREKFAAQVGDEMVKMAGQLARAKSLKGEILDLHTAQTVCGLTTSEGDLSAEELIAQADAQGYIVNELGFIQRNDTTYIIKSPLHASLIQHKIQHIDDELERLMLSNHHLVPLAIAQRMLLNLILKQFDEVTIANGKKIYSKVPFQFPSLVITLGEF